MSTKSPGLRLEVTTGDTGARSESWRDAGGRLQDPPDGTPAIRWYRPYWGSPRWCAGSNTVAERP